jgi:hypothetical protein
MNYARMIYTYQNSRFWAKGLMAANCRIADILADRGCLTRPSFALAGFSCSSTTVCFEGASDSEIV